MSDLQDNISELSSLSSYPSSPGTSSQISLDTPSGVSQVYLDDNDTVNNVLSSWGPLAPIPIEPYLYVHWCDYSPTLLMRVSHHDVNDGKNK